MPVIITNKYNLPQPIVDAVTYDDHQQTGEWSVTQIIDTPQPHILKRIHNYEEDVMDRIWAMTGTSNHVVAERAGLQKDKVHMALYYIEEAISLLLKDETVEDVKMQDFNGVTLTLSDYLLETTRVLKAIAINKPREYITENLISMDILGTKISGSIDLYEVAPDVIFDYKNTTVFSVMYTPNNLKHIAQVNVYAHLLRHGYSHKFNEKLDASPKIAKIIYILRDWSAYDLSKDTTGLYPKQKVLVKEVKLYSDEKMQNYLETQVNIFNKALNGDMKECSKEDRWVRKIEFKVIKQGNKVATRVFDRREDASQFAADMNEKGSGFYMVLEKNGESVRCERYCPVNKFCKQYNTQISKGAA